MKRYLVHIFSLTTFLNLSVFCKAQVFNKVPAAYYIYLLANKTGTENCSVSDSNQLKIYDIDYAYNDRGAKRKLNTRIAVTENYEPQYVSMSGFTSRWSEVHVNFQMPDSLNYFAITNAAPATLQQLLISYWEQRKQPQTITALPNHQSVNITAKGYDTVDLNGNNLTLQRLLIKGLIWGNEFAWITSDGVLVFVSTNDTEGDKTEIINTTYEPLFNKLLSLSDGYAVAETAKEYPSIKNQHEYTSLVNGTLINVNSKDSLTENALVIIHNGNIEYAGKMDAAKLPQGIYTIDVKGKYILPGLWDMHAHLMQAEWLPKYIHEGVTTVRDCGNEFQFINALQLAINTGNIEGPQIIKAGLIDGKSSNALGNMQAASKDGVIKLVHLYKDSGFAQVKIYSSVKQSLMKNICDEAHSIGLTVTGHIPDGVTTTTAIEDGMDMVSHVSFFRNSMFTTGEKIDYSDKRTAKFVQLLLDKKTVLDPTLSVFETADASYIKNIAFYKAVTYQLYKIGVPIIAGTDMSEGGVAHELALYVESGFTPLQAIQSATIVPATIMKMETLTGSVEAGKRADIFITNYNPLTDIKNLKSVATVISGTYIYNLQ